MNYNRLKITTGILSTWFLGAALLSADQLESEPNTTTKCTIDHNHENAKILTKKIIDANDKQILFINISNDAPTKSGTPLTPATRFQFSPEALGGFATADYKHLCIALPNTLDKVVQKLASGKIDTRIFSAVIDMFYENKNLSLEQREQDKKVMTNTILEAAKQGMKIHCVLSEIDIKDKTDNNFYTRQRTRFASSWALYLKRHSGYFRKSPEERKEEFTKFRDKYFERKAKQVPRLNKIITENNPTRSRSKEEERKKAYEQFLFIAERINEKIGRDKAVVYLSDEFSGLLRNDVDFFLRDERVMNVAVLSENGPGDTQTGGVVNIYLVREFGDGSVRVDENTALDEEAMRKLLSFLEMPEAIATLDDANLYMPSTRQPNGP